MTTLHISAEVMPEVMSILVLTTKPHQHFIRTEAMPTFIFVMKPRQHSILAFALAIEVATIFALSHVKTSFSLKPCQHS